MHAHPVLAHQPLGQLAQGQLTIGLDPADHAQSQRLLKQRNLLAVAIRCVGLFGHSVLLTLPGRRRMNIAASIMTGFV